MTQKTSYEQIKDDIAEYGPSVIVVAFKLFGALLYLAAPFALIALFVWGVMFDGVLNTLLMIWPIK